jgi:hypothetical protein
MSPTAIGDRGQDDSGRSDPENQHDDSKNNRWRDPFERVIGCDITAPQNDPRTPASMSSHCHSGCLPAMIS